MKILFTKSESILSRIIRKMAGEPVSHCAVLAGGFVMHSNLYGVHIDTEEYFRKHCEVVYSVEVKYDSYKVNNMISSKDHSSYDFGGLLYCGLRILCPFLPKKNLWQTTGMYMCTEWVQESLGEEIDSMITPYQLYLQLEQKQQKEKTV